MQIELKPMRVINHKTMRRIIGLIAFQLPIVVVLLSGQQELSSISISYWTDARDIFVGSLIAVAFFLFAYNGTGDCRKDIEYWFSKVACLAAIIVALFPTKAEKNCETCSPAKWIQAISEFFGTTSEVIHYTFAIILFISLILLISFFSLRAKNKGELTRSRIYFVISVSMLVGMPVVYVLGELSKWYEPVFWVEFVGLWLFAAGWFLAGAYPSKPEEGVPEGATELAVIKVNPRNHDHSTNIQIEEGVKYYFRAKGCWKDWFLECGANGWGPDWNPLARWNRIKWKPLFMLCGNVGKSEDEDLNFCIGDKNTWSVRDEVKEKLKELEDRELYLFANDWETRYGNNKELGAKEGGPLKVTIYRLK